MDPFAPDSDGDEDRGGGTSSRAAAAATAASTSQGRALHRHITPFVNQSSSSQSSVYGDDSVDAGQRLHGDDDDDDDDDGPPASIVLDTHDQAATSPTPATAPPSTRPQQPAMSESVRLTRMDKRASSSARRTTVLHDVEQAIDVPDDEDEMDDERAGLMRSPNARNSRHSTPGSSRGSSNTPNVANDVLSRMARKIRRGADRIRAQDGLDDAETQTHPLRRLNAKERALWKWGTLENMDEFLQQVYHYYVGKGLVCIVLTKVLNLLTIAFVIGFSTFLVGCVDYSAIKHDGRLSDVVVGQCFSRFSGLTILAFSVFAGLYGWQVVRFGFDMSSLIAMRHFYTYLLNIPDADVQSISWHEVVSRIARLRESHPTLSLSSSQSGGAPVSAGKLDAHDVANRIMRQENYLVALFNKDVLNLNNPLPGLQHRAPELTRSLEWNLTFCLLGFLFDSKGQVRKQFVTERHRKELIEGLKRRFVFMAVINAIFAPFIVIYLLFYSFFRYFEEYHKNPSYLGARQYTQFARWKFREFNELPHIFRRRCHNSYPYAQRYIDQFPKERIAIVARFVSFVAGSFTAVLILASVMDPDLFVHFDITPQRNVLFYLGVFGAILAVSRGLVPDEQQVFEPEVLLRAVIEYTHYLPERWKDRFHAAEVHAEFGTMYRLKISIFLSEVLSVLFTPFILWKSLPHSAPAIIDFFREFTVHVDGLGYVCSFAVFDFQRHGNVKFGAPRAIRDQRMSSKEGKMEQSLLGFRAANPTWQPTDPTASLFLSRLAAEMGAASGGVNVSTTTTTPPPPPPPPMPSQFATSPPPMPAPIGRMSGNSLAHGLGRGHDHGHIFGGVNFTPANSTLAQRSQLYNDAFERSILLASKPGNAVALHASATKAGTRSGVGGGNGGPAGKSRTLQAVNEDRDIDDHDDPISASAAVGAVMSDDDDPLSATAAAGVFEYEYEDARPGRIGQGSGRRHGVGEAAAANGQAQPVNLRGLLQHIGTSKW